MKHLTSIIILIVILSFPAISQVAINSTGTEAAASAMLDISSTEKGMLAPRMTTAQRTAIASPANGLLVYDTDTKSFWHYNNDDSLWIELVSGAIEINDLSDAITDGNSVFIGTNSGVSHSGSDNYNTALGYNCLKEITTGRQNTTIGSLSMINTETGSSNTAVGFCAMYSNISGWGNVAIGENSNRGDPDGNGNTYVGSESGAYSSGDDNCGVGQLNMPGNIGDRNTSIGKYAGYDYYDGTEFSEYSGCVLIGYAAGSQNNSDNKLYIQNSRSEFPLIGGDFSTDQVDINGTIKITGGTPGNGKVLTSDADGLASWETNSGATELNDLSNAITDGTSVFIGENSGINNNGGNYNTSLGYASLRDLTTGVYNTAIGSLALFETETGNNNTSMGYRSMAYNITGEGNVAIGVAANSTDYDGDSSTFVGTKSGFSIDGTKNCGYGYGSLAHIDGDRNTAIGSLAGFGSSSGSSPNFDGCVFLGYEAGRNNTEDNKLYIENSNSSTPLIGGDFSTNQVDINGTIKITGGTPGNGKVLTSNADGLGTWRTPATYASDINSLSDAAYNGSDLFLGNGAGNSNSGSNSSVAVGRNALNANTTSIFNTAIGYYSLDGNTGERNTAVGSHSLGANTSGSNNTSIGYSSGVSSILGSYNTFIGYRTQMNTTAIKVNSTAIGNEAIITASDQVRIGNSSVTSIGGVVPWSTVSDGRFKENVKEDVAGLDFVLNLRPVSYIINKQAFNNFVGSEYKSNNRTTSKRECGFVAQEVEQLIQNTGVEFNGVDAPENGEDYYGIRYSQFVIPLVKSVQELNEKLEKENAQLKAQNAEILQRIEKLEELLLDK